MGKYGVIRHSEATSAKTLLLFDQGESTSGQRTGNESLGILFFGMCGNNIMCLYTKNILIEVLFCGILCCTTFCFYFDNKTLL